MQQDAEKEFNSSISSYETDDDYSTEVNVKVGVERKEISKTVELLGGAHERKFEGEFSLDNENDIKAEFFYVPGKDENYNTISNVSFMSGSEPFKGRSGEYVLFTGKNDRKIGTMFFSNNSDYESFSNQFLDNKHKAVLKLARDHDTKVGGTRNYDRWKAYYESKK